MKKFFAKKTILFLLFSTVIIFPGCAKEDAPPEPETADEQHVFVSGSASVIPLLKELAGAFAVREPDIEIVFLPDSHSRGGVRGTVEEHYDIGAVSREMSLDEKKDPLQYLHLSIDGLVFVTNNNVHIHNLTSKQIRDIYSGRIKNWTQVGGPNAKIAVIDRPEHTSAKIALRKAILGGRLRPDSETVVVERPGQVTDSIQLIPHSIGYTSLGEIISENPAVNMISIDGVEPTPSNLKSGRYRIYRPFGFVLGPEPKVATMRFVNFIFSDTGANIIGNAGYVPTRYEIVIGIVPERDPMVQKQRYTPLAEYLSNKLGEKYTVKLRLFPTYIEVCRSLAKGEINAAFLGSLAYTTVREHVDVLARPDYDGVSTYRGILFVRADSNIGNLDQMKDKRLILGGKTTTAGYVFPLYYFMRNGINDYQNYFSKASFVGTHEDAILAVLHDRADVGAAKDLIFNMIAKENPKITSAVRILAESPAVPSNAFVVRKDLSLPCFDCHQKQARGKGAGALEAELNISSAMRKHLLSLPDDPEGRKALAALGNATRFIETTDADYSELYNMLEEIHLRPQGLLNND
jgi:phosphate transport system substrate-binding protein